jgi:hypothetical protein
MDLSREKEELSRTTTREVLRDKCQEESLAWRGESFGISRCDDPATLDVISTSTGGCEGGKSHRHSKGKAKRGHLPRYRDGAHSQIGQQ